MSGYYKSLYYSAVNRMRLGSLYNWALAEPMAFLNLAQSIIQSSTVTPRSNITWYYTQHNSDWHETYVRFIIYKIHRLTRLTANWPRYNGTALLHMKQCHSRTNKIPHHATILCWEKNCGIVLRCDNEVECNQMSINDDVIKWKHFPRYWPFMRGIHR